MCLVHCSGQLPVGGPSCLEIFRPFLELSTLLGEFLSQRDDTPRELVNVRWSPEPGLAPCPLAELLGKPLLQLARRHS